MCSQLSSDNPEERYARLRRAIQVTIDVISSTPEACVPLQVLTSGARFCPPEPDRFVAAKGLKLLPLERTKDDLKSYMTGHLFHRNRHRKIEGFRRTRGENHECCDS